ncbi:MAG TPA: extracellular solute-binding protein [Candidatus Choladousia intestinigallinarum]|nr:extracellular solute-binding protein [Candidatus Choladousia intestinigallinarum]
MNKKVFPVIILCLLLTCIFPLYVNASAKEASSENTVTIYLYRDSELPLREAAVRYMQNRRFVAGTPQESSYPDISWNLVDKSHLTEEEFQALLREELAAGGGPDILLTGDGGFDDSQELLSSGYLYDLSGYESLFMRNDQVDADMYIPCVLEAGQQGGVQYLLPLTAEFPILFGQTEVLNSAGLDGNWKDFDSFVEELCQAQRQSGLAAFAEPSTLAWLWDYGNMDGQAPDKPSFDTLSSLEAEADASYFHSATAFKNGQCLLSGCGKGNFQQMLQNLLRMEPSDFSFFLVPDMDGNVSVQISQAAGINKNSKNPEAALAALAGIQEGYGYSARGEEDLSVRPDSAEWEGSVVSSHAAAYYFFDHDPFYTASRTYLENDLLDWLWEQAQTRIQGAAFKNPEDISSQNDPLELPEDAEVISVLYNGNGIVGMDSPLTQWLADAAGSFQQEESYIQLVPSIFDDILLVNNFSDLEATVDAAVDLLITDTSTIAVEKNFSPDSQVFASLLEKYREDLDNLYAVPYDEVFWEGEKAGIPIGIKSFGIWYNRELFNQLGLEEDDLKDGLESWTELVETANEKGRASGIQQPVLTYTGNSVVGIISCLTEETLFILDPEEGWQTNMAVWTDAVSRLYSLIQNCAIANAEKTDALNSLLGGTSVMVLGGSDLGAMIGQSSSFQTEDLGYIPLSSYVSVYAAFLSEHAENPESAFLFLMEALQSNLYEETIRRIGMEPVTGKEKREFVCLPIYHWNYKSQELWDSLWLKDADPEELAQNHMPCPWMKE